MSISERKPAESDKLFNCHLGIVSDDLIKS